MRQGSAEWASGIIPTFDDPDRLTQPPSESAHHYLPPAGAERLPEG